MPARLLVILRSCVAAVERSLPALGPLTLVCGMSSLSAQDIVSYPSDTLYANIANPSRNQFDVLVHTLAIANRGEAPFRLDSLVVTVRAMNQTTARHVVDLEAAERTSSEIAGMRSSPASPFAELAFPRMALGDAGEIATSRHVKGGSALILPSLLVSTSARPTGIEVRWWVTRDGGAVRSAARELAVFLREPTAYQFPLRGAWFASAMPGPTSHHRWNPQTEFAEDFWRVDSAGRLFRTTGSTAGDFPGFGEPVHAGAEGVVIAAVGDVRQDWPTRLRGAGESAVDYGRRIQRLMADALRGDRHRALMGNHVVIAHAAGEYSVYGHLQTGSVRVRVGDRVAAGQQIANVGDTGDSHLPHLHFQINAGPDPLASRSIPFRFVDAPPHGIDPGTFRVGPKAPQVP